MTPTGGSHGGRPIRLRYGSMFLRAPSAAKLLDLPISTFYQLVPL